MSLPGASHEAVAAIPRQLLNFFKRHPPAAATAWAATSSAQPSSRPRQNPFWSTRNKFTHKYNEPRYSIRRQQDLYNLATACQLQDLLPPRVAHKEGKVGRVMKGLVRWKGKTMERTRDARREAIKTKTAAARKVVRTRRTNTKAKKRAQTTGLIVN